MPTTAQQITALVARVADLEYTVGNPTVTYAEDEPAPYELANGESPLLYRVRQQSFKLDKLVRGVVQPPSPAPVVVVPTPAPPLPSVPVVPTTFTPDEIQTLGNLNFAARVVLNHVGSVRDRLYDLAMLLKAGTWATWEDDNRGYLLGLMAATPDGKYPPNRALIDRLAAAIGVALSATDTPGAPSPVVIAPNPPPAPSGDTAALRNEVAALRAELRAVQATQSSGIPSVVTQDIVFKGKVGLGGMKPDGAAQLHIVNENGEAAVLFGVKQANGEMAWGQKGLAPDGGLRDLNNEYVSTEGVPAIDPDNGQPFTDYLKVPQPNRTHSQIGTDSLNQFSIRRAEPGFPHEYTQDAVLKIYEGQKVIAWESWRRGWKWKFGIDAKYGPGRWWEAIFG